MVGGRTGKGILLLSRPRSAMSFRYDSNYLFATYAQSGGLEHQALYDFINGICAVDWARICTEHHADGNLHNHVVCKFSRRFSTRNPRVFDFSGIHPKLEPVKSVPGAIKYCGKEQFTDFGDVPSHGSKRDASEALGLAGDPDEAKYLHACLEARVPYQYAKRFRELAFSDTTNTIGTDYEANLDWECEQLQQQTLPENSCAVLVGPSGIGKSAWAKRVAPKPCLWVSHLDVLRMYRPSYHKSIIFDDMSFSHMPVPAQIHLTDWTDPRQIHCRYGYASIPAKTVKIFTCNEWPFTDHQAIDRRTTKIFL